VEQPSVLGYDLIMVTFPAIAPNALRFRAPEFPVRSNTSLSGVVSRRIFGNRGSRSTLDLTFDNISDQLAAQFLDAWNLAKGTLEILTVSSTTFSGAGTDLLGYISDGGDQLAWHFAEAPEVQRVKPGLSSVTVRLEATRDA
jgi:hypothetical protein